MTPTLHQLHLQLSYEPDRGYQQQIDGPLVHDFVAFINGHEVLSERIACANRSGSADVERIVPVGEGLHKILVMERRSGNKTEVTLEIRCETWISLYAWGRNTPNHPRFSFFLDGKPPDTTRHAPPQ